VGVIALQTLWVLSIKPDDNEASEVATIRRHTNHPSTLVRLRKTNGGSARMLHPRPKKEKDLHA
jgi:hypothetical protein